MFLYDYVITGIGYAGMLLCSIALVHQCFMYNRGMVTGISTLGYTVGIVLSAIIWDLAFNPYQGWQ